MNLKRIVSLSCILPLLLLAQLAMAERSVTNQNCMMCHRDVAADLIQAHSNCMVCHSGGAEEHATNPRVAPEPVTTATCQICHRPTEEFRAEPYHKAEVDCSACHFIHRPN